MAFIFYVNRFNKLEIKRKFSEITLAEGVTIRNLLEVSGNYLAEAGEERLTAFLDRLYENESIIYIGLFNGDSLSYLLSRFEGFFPVVPGQGEYRILDTPVGKIFEIPGRFKGKKNTDYRLYIGFDYEFLTTFEAAASRGVFMVVGLFSLTMVLVMILVFYFNKRVFHKEVELLQEKQEKERFKELALLTAEIAHEIKNPLNSIYLSFNTLEKHCSSDEDALFYRKAIKEEIKRISTILQSYSDLSKEVRPVYALVNLAQFIDAFKFLVEKELEQRQVEFRFDLQGETSANTDENLLKQILLNLVKNSMEAGASRISVQMEAADNSLNLQVTDNGKGIDTGNKGSIFKPYISTKTKGMGLGLYITLRLVQAMKGEIQLNSHQPGNTRFQINLPFDARESQVTNKEQ
jgi:signal transduction histidine kinase